MQQEGSILIKNINGLAPNPAQGKTTATTTKTASEAKLFTFYAKNNKHFLEFAHEQDFQMLVNYKLVLFIAQACLLRNWSCF